MKGPAASGLPALASIDRRALFFGTFCLVMLLALSALAIASAKIAEVSRGVNKRIAEAQRTERIAKQTWWPEESQKAAAQVEAIKQRFWAGKTLGLIRADVERFVQGLVTGNGLKAQALLVDSKAVDSKGFQLLPAQVKVHGPTAKILDMIDGLASGPQELFVAGVNIRFFKDQATAEIRLEAPIIVEEEKAAGQATAASPAPPTR